MSLSETSLPLFVLPLDAPQGWGGAGPSPTAELLELLAFLLAAGKGLARKHCSSPLPPVQRGTDLPWRCLPSLQ